MNVVNIDMLQHPYCQLSPQKFFRFDGLGLGWTTRRNSDLFYCPSSLRFSLLHSGASFIQGLYLPAFTPSTGLDSILVLSAEIKPTSVMLMHHLLSSS